jgi:uncharacterized protein (TIGR02147 family)
MKPMPTSLWSPMEILDFEDYRDFIKQRLEKMRAENSFFSFQYCAKKMKTSKSYLKLVIGKKRHITLTKITALSELLKLTPEEQPYFVFLFLRDIAKDQVLREYFNTILLNLADSEVYRNEVKD